MVNIEIIEMWYRGRCDGNWEHDYGFTLESTDNPGWLVTMDMDPVDLSEVIGWREGIERTVNVRMSDGKIRISQNP